MKQQLQDKRLGFAEWMQHGPTDHFLLSDEEAEHFENFRSRLSDSLLPVGTIEYRLCDQLCRLFWRQDRGQRLEKELLDSARAKKGKTACEAGNHASLLISAVTRDGFGAKVFGRVIRYNEQLSSELMRTLHMLLSLQQARLKDTIG